MKQPTERKRRQSTGRAKDPDVRRPLIVQAALMCISELGIAKTRVADIAARAGTSPGLVVYHFKTLEAVIVAAFELAEDGFYANLSAIEQQYPEATDRMRALARLSLAGDADERYWSVWMEMWSESRRSEWLMAVRRNLNDHWLAALRSCLLLGQRQEVFGQCDVNAVALKLAIHMDGMAVALISRDPNLDGDTLSRMWLEMASAELNAPDLLRG